MRQSGAAGEAGPRGLETLTQWLDASRAERAQALGPVLARIREMDPLIKSWVQVEPQRPTGDGPLNEIPFGAKEIIETQGLATEYGSPIYRGRTGVEDAAIVHLMRQRGGLLLGKTRSTAFAYFTPGPTRNPRNLAHTPGGSSSGSAAAVAAGMVPVALGTQTAGSILRPASFCGVTGFKPSYGLLPMAGILPFAASLDTLGFFTHTATDMAALWTAVGQSPGGTEELAFATPDPLPAVEPAMARAFADALARLRRAGIGIKPVELAASLERLRAAHRTIMYYEGARFHEALYREHGAGLAELADLVREGLRISKGQYDEARSAVAAGRVRMAEIFKETPVILLPAATGPAPRGLASTGDPRLNAPWTALGTPAIAIPLPVGDGLPLGLQLTADLGQDGRLLQAAVRLEGILRSGP